MIKSIPDELIQLKKKSAYVKARKIPKIRLYYLAATIVLIICLCQALRGLYLNVAKYITLNKQFSKLESLNINSKEKNYDLKQQLKNYTSSKGIEALARDNLKMVGKDEILVIIREPAEKINLKK